MTFKWALNWTGRQKWKLWFSAVLNIFAIALMTCEPFIFRDIIDNVLMPQKFDRLLPLLLFAFTIGLLFMALRYFSNILAEQASQNAVYRIRSELFDKLLAQSPDFFRRNKVGDLINKCSGDVDMMRHFLCFVIPKSLEAVLMIVSVLVVFLSISPLYTLILFSVTPLTCIVATRLGRTVRPAFSEAREQLSKLNTAVQENISGNRVVKAFVREEYEIDKFQKENAAYRDKNISAVFIWLTYGPIIESISSLLTVLNLVVGGVMVAAGHISLGQLNIFLSLAWALNEPMNMIGMLVNDTQRFNASIEKIMELYYANPSIQSPAKPRGTGEIRGDISFRGVTLRYGENTVLDRVDLDIKAGQTIGFMGPTGSGKTSLVNLIPRFIDVSEGAVLIDNVNVENYELQTLRKNIGMTMQEVFLFSDTVESNIAYGVPDADMDTVTRSSVSADADSFVRTMPEGYDTIIGERGTGLSGGQKQRVSLARALAPEAPILILDDTTSAVDMETEKYIQEKLRALPKSSTTLIIAQRVSSVMHADRIYILDNGKISESGTHAELMEKRGYYYQTCLLQSGGAEEAVSA